MMKMFLSRIFLAAALAVFALAASAQTLRASRGADRPYLISLGRMAFASSSQQGSNPTLAVDNNETTRWESTWDSAQEWLVVDLGKTAHISSIRLIWENAYAKRYEIQFSADGETWKTVYTNPDSRGGTEEKPLTGSARYVRLLMTEKAQPAYGYSLFEFQVYGTGGLTERPPEYGVNLATGKPVQASSLREAWWMRRNGVLDQTGVRAGNAVDGASATAWTSAEKDLQWLSVDLGREQTIGRVIIHWDSGAGKIYDVQTSADGQRWETVYRQMQGYSHLTDNIELCVPARFLRVYGYTRVENGNGFSIRELEVYPWQRGAPAMRHEIAPLPEPETVHSKTGKGSYLAKAMHEQKARIPVFRTDNIQVPIDSNDWWQSALIKRFGNALCVLPLKAWFSAGGLSVLTLTDGWMQDAQRESDTVGSVTTETRADLTLLPETMDAATAYDRVSAYSDFSVTIDLCDKNGAALSATFVKGSPYVYVDPHETRTLLLFAPSVARIFDDAGAALLAPGATYTGDHIGLQIIDTDNKAKTPSSESFYCLSVPPGTRFKRMQNHLAVTFPEGAAYLSIGTMPDATALRLFHRHGYAFVTHTDVSYTYDEPTAALSVEYRLDTDMKRAGYPAEPLQCVMPHQWKHLSAAPRVLAVYPSVRGPLKAIAANAFSTRMTFQGLLPTFALPAGPGFDSARLLSYLNQLEDATRRLTPAADAYWEGKNLHPLAMGVLMADQTGETELRDLFLQRLKTILVNWFHYEGEDDVSYFIYDDQWGTLYYAHSQFGANAEICDHHFTYGYFLFSATVLAAYDAQFRTDYREMIELLIRDYANPSRVDPAFCRFRNFDLYEGHSWAGGYADNDSGNNQESASEALFSWVGLYLWGVLTENPAYRDAGIFGFLNEMEAVKQYWFNFDGENWLAAWPFQVVGQVYGNSNLFATFFGGQPLYVYGIQWLPVSEYLTYYGTDPQRCAEIYAGLLADTEEAMRKAALAARSEGRSEAQIRDLLQTYPQADTGWQHITWPFLSLSDPALALSKFTEQDAKVQKNDTANTYWFILNMLRLGTRTDRIRAVGPLCASVYFNPATEKYTAVVWNPTDEARTVRFFSDAGEVATATVSAKALVDFEVFEDRHITVAQTPAPVISVPSGTYDDTQYVRLSSPAEDAVIRYTTDGSRPGPDSPVYAGPFAVSSDATVKALAMRPGHITSPLASSTIRIDGAAVSGTENVAAGKPVQTSSRENDAMGGHLLTDGDAATRWSSAFSDDEWFALDLGQLRIINNVVLHWENSYATSFSLQVSQDGETWKTVYETDAGRGGRNEIVFDAVRCRFVKLLGRKRATAYGYSLWEVEVYEAARAQRPVVSAAPGADRTHLPLTMTSPTKGVEIRYTLDGTTPTARSPLYVPGLTLTRPATIKAAAFKKGMIPSPVTTVNCRLPAR